MSNKCLNSHKTPFTELTTNGKKNELTDYLMKMLVSALLASSRSNKESKTGAKGQNFLITHFLSFLTACLFFVVNKKILFPVKPIDYFPQSSFIQPQVYQLNHPQSRSGTTATSLMGATHTLSHTHTDTHRDDI